MVKVNQTMLFRQVIPKWVETINNLKRHVYKKREQVASYNKQKEELKTGKTLIHIDYGKVTIALSKMKFRGHIFVSKTSVFLIPVHITVKLNKATW